jgi:hypothetical protein
MLEYIHIVLEQPVSWTPLIPRSNYSIVRSPGFVFILGNTHSVFATDCELKSPDIASVICSSCLIVRSPGFIPMLSYAHSMFVRGFVTAFELNAPDITSVCLSSCDYELNSLDISTDHRSIVIIRALDGL